MSCIPMFNRKRFFFELTLGLRHLNNVPIYNGVFFAKIRLLNVRHSRQFSARVEITDNHVVWNSEHTFAVNIAADPVTSYLQSCPMKISIRRETKGGQSYEKLGYVLLNVSCFARAGAPEGRRYILSTYRHFRERADNSLLHVTVSMTCTHGDCVFLVPRENMKNCMTEDGREPGTRGTLGDSSESGIREGGPRPDEDYLSEEDATSLSHSDVSRQPDPLVASDDANDATAATRGEPLCGDETPPLSRRPPPNLPQQVAPPPCQQRSVATPGGLSGSGGGGPQSSGYFSQHSRNSSLSSAHNKTSCQSVSARSARVAELHQVCDEPGCGEDGDTPPCMFASLQYPSSHARKHAPFESTGAALLETGAGHPLTNNSLPGTIAASWRAPGTIS